MFLGVRKLHFTSKKISLPKMNYQTSDISKCLFDTFKSTKKLTKKISVLASKKWSNNFQIMKTIKAN